MRQLLSRYRRRLANNNSVMSYAALGIIGGIASGLVVLGFERAIDELDRLWQANAQFGEFEALPLWARFALPAAGALLLGLLYSSLRAEDRETGIVHVISRMHSHYGALPLRNALLQFVGGAFALASGQSGGREGPSVHLGGAINSLMGQGLGLPNASLRVLIGCGTAGGIAAAFHTPLAGVIFAMEVIIAEYSVVGFIPVILAAVSASAVSSNLSGGGALFNLPALQLQSLLEMPYLILLGVCCGAAIAAFIFLTRMVSRHSPATLWLRFTLAGCLTGLLALAVPEILGVGYDSLELIMRSELAMQALLLIAGCKLLSAAAASGVGMPVGVIGPSLIIGACIGGALGIVGNQLQPELASQPLVYVLMGMGAAMAAVLNAPLAAILAIVEMTHSMSLVVPAMLAIVAATLTSNGLFRQPAAHKSALRELKRVVPDDPLSRLLHSTDVSSIMDQRAVRVPVTLSQDDREPLLEFTPQWCVIARGDEDLYLVSGPELLRWLAEHAGDEEHIDLTAADIRRWTLTMVPVQATLYQAVDAMNSATVEAVAVCERSAGSGKLILHGVVTREHIQKHLSPSL